MNLRLFLILLAMLFAFSCYEPLDFGSLCHWTDPDCADEDFDHDGVKNSNDNCPAIDNADQADMDEDGLGDVCDDSTDCGGGKLDPNTDLCWQEPKAGGTYAWQAAIDYCDALDLGGHTDWVLPTRQNFVDLLGGCDAAVLGGIYGYCNSCAESTTCTALFASDIDWYWSSSPVADLDDHAWVVGFNPGGVGSNSDDYDANDVYNVRCVR